MRIAQDSTSLLALAGSPDYLSDGSSAKSTPSVVSTTKSSTDKTEKSSSSTSTSTGSQRETYGLQTLQLMSDSEYAAFERATAALSPNEKMRAAQSLHLVAKSFQQAQSTINGGGLVNALNGKDDFFTSNLDALDKGIQVLKQMNDGDSKNMSNFLTRYKGALSSNGLNLIA
jgi:hypothetical protein